MRRAVARISSALVFADWRRKREVERLRDHANPEWEPVLGRSDLEWEQPFDRERPAARRRRNGRAIARPLRAPARKRRNGRPRARARRLAVMRPDPRLLGGGLALAAIAVVGAGGYLIGESTAVGSSEAADAREASYQEAFAAARDDAIATGEQRGRSAGVRAGRKSAERAGDRAGARRGAAAAEREEARIAAAAAAAEATAAAEREAAREARQAEPAAERTTPTPEPDPEPVTPAPVAPAPEPVPCYDVTGHPC
jgi:hypothetical protein